MAGRLLPNINIITMNDVPRPQGKPSSSTPRSTSNHSYKLVFSALRPHNKQRSIEKDTKPQIRLASPSCLPKQAYYQLTSNKKTCPHPNPSSKQQRYLDSTIPVTPQCQPNRQDLRIDLKSLQQGGGGKERGERVQNKIMFHSQRKEGWELRLTSRCLQIEDIILTAPYFTGREDLKATSKVIKLKRPSK